LICNLSGRKIIPSRSAGYFSKSNWADQIERQDGREIFVEKTSMLVKICSKLKPSQWAKIIEAASTYARQKKITKVETTIVIQSSDFNIEDGDVDDESDCDVEDGDDDGK
jgi:hypothetical protein